MLECRVIIFVDTVFYYCLLHIWTAVRNMQLKLFWCWTLKLFTAPLAAGGGGGGGGGGGVWIYVQYVNPGDACTFTCCL